MTKQLLTYPIIAEFLSTLRMEGHLIGVGKHLQIQSLLKQLPDDIDFETLKLAIVPLIAQSPQEQERLYETFDQCVKRIEEQQPLLSETTPSVFDDNFSSKKISRGKILMIGLLLTLFIGGGIYWYLENQKKKVPPIETPQLPTTTPDPKDTLKVETTKPTTDSLSYFVENKPYPFPNHLDDYDIDISPTQQWLSNNWSWLRWVLATILTAFLVAIWRYRAWIRRKLVAQQDPNDKPPYIWNINIEGVEPVLMGDSLERVTQMLRQRSQTDTMRLDVERTVNATIEQGGMPLFKYRRLTSPTDYLLLIDRQTVRNHRAQLFDALYESFKSQEVEIARYFFDSDVRVCYNEDYPHGVPLSDLQQRYYQSRLLIVGTGAQLLSPLSGKAAAWTTVFNQWRNRALFSPKPLKSWGYDERQLSTLFTTLPATLQSLGFWVEELDAGADAHFDDWQEKIDDAPQAPILPDDNDPLPVLQLFFEPDLVRWVAACAIYPTLHWDLTLWLGQNIETRDANGQKNTPLSNFDSLSQICRLSWFVKGEMPNETRTALLNWLEKHDAPLLNHLRTAIAIELQKNPPPKDSAAFDKFRMNIALNQWLTTTDAKEKKQLEDEISQFLERGTEPDFTVIKYLNAPRTALDFIVPDAWKKFVHPSGFSALGWVKEWKDLWWLLPIWILGVLICLYNYKFFKSCDNGKVATVVANEKIHYLCISDIKGLLVYSEHLIKESIQQQDSIRLKNLLTPLSTESWNNIADVLINQEPKFLTGMAGLSNVGNDIILLIQERERNFATEFYKLAKSKYDLGLKDSACFFLNIANKFDTLDNDIKVAQALLCGKKVKNDSINIAPIISGSVFSKEPVSFKDGSVTFENGQTVVFDNPLADVQITGSGVNTRTNAQGRYTLTLPPQYPSPTITLTFVKNGYNTVVKTVKINKVKELPIIELIPISTSQSRFSTINTFQTPLTIKNSNIIDLFKGTEWSGIATQYDDGERLRDEYSFHIKFDSSNVNLNNLKGITKISFSDQYAFYTIEAKFINNQLLIEEQRIIDQKIDTGSWYLKHIVLDYNSQTNSFDGFWYVNTNRDVKRGRINCKNSVKGKINWGFDFSNTNIIIPKTAFVKGGTFTMGCTKEQGDDCQDNEKPAHQVTLSDFNMGQFEVTIEQYLQFSEETKTHYPDWLEQVNNYNVETGKDLYYKNKGYQRKGSEKLPIVGVSWNDATAYCQWLSSKTGKNYRLPTEAEWEYAARGGSKSGYFKYCGSNNIGEVAWYDDNSDSKTHTVGTKKANELGIYDMSGNVWEWCSDWYDSYNNNAVRNPTGAAKGSNRVNRGGSWGNTSQYCRAPHRYGNTPTYRNYNVGFRVVSSLQ
jgi:formylglycine-generating enzyme required for sulfatase activity